MKKSVFLSVAVCGFFSYSAACGMIHKNMGTVIMNIFLESQNNGGAFYLNEYKKNNNIFDVEPDNNGNACGMNTVCTKSKDANPSLIKSSVISSTDAGGKTFLLSSILSEQSNSKFFNKKCSIRQKDSEDSNNNIINDSVRRNLLSEFDGVQKNKRKEPVFSGNITVLSEECNRIEEQVIYFSKKDKELSGKQQKKICREESNFVYSHKEKMLKELNNRRIYQITLCGLRERLAGLERVYFSVLNEIFEKLENMGFSTKKISAEFENMSLSAQVEKSGELYWLYNSSESKILARLNGKKEYCEDDFSVKETMLQNVEIIAMHCKVLRGLWSKLIKLETMNLSVLNEVLERLENVGFPTKKILAELKKMNLFAQKEKVKELENMNLFTQKEIFRNFVNETIREMSFFVQEKMFVKLENMSLYVQNGIPERLKNMSFSAREKMLKELENMSLYVQEKMLKELDEACLSAREKMLKELENMSLYVQKKMFVKLENMRFSVQEKMLKELENKIQIITQLISENIPKVLKITKSLNGAFHLFPNPLEINDRGFSHCNEREIYTKKLSISKMNTKNARTVYGNGIYKKKTVAKINNDKNCSSESKIGRLSGAVITKVACIKHHPKMSEGLKKSFAQWIKELKKADKAYKIVDCLLEGVSLLESEETTLGEKINSWNNQSMRNKYKQANGTKDEILNLLKGADEKAMQALLTAQS